MNLILEKEITNEYKSIYNRRYIGSKYKLSNWILNIINTNCVGDSFCDLFAGTGIISERILQQTNIENIIINDILFSNYIIYNAFFYQDSYDTNKLNDCKDFFNYSIELEENYFSHNFGAKFYSLDDSVKIGSIRE